MEESFLKGDGCPESVKIFEDLHCNYGHLHKEEYWGQIYEGSLYSEIQTSYKRSLLESSFDFFVNCGLMLYYVMLKVGAAGIVEREKTDKSVLGSNEGYK